MDLIGIENPGFYSSASYISFVNFIAITCFSEFYTVCVIKTFLDTFALNGTVPSIAINVDNNFNETFQNAVDGGCQAFIVSEGALIRFLDIFVEVHDIADQRYASKKLMILMNSKNSSILRKMVVHKNILQLRDILIVEPNSGTDSVHLSTTKLSNNGTRSTIVVEIVPVYGPNYFPDKLNNMNGIPIHLSTLKYPPFSYYEETVPEKANARYEASFKEDLPLFIDGTEVSLILEFCRRYNCTVEASFDEQFLWGDVYDNHTGDGLLGSVIEHRSDIAVAAIYYWRQPYKFATYTLPISRSGVTVLVPKPRILPPWRTPFLSFTMSLWAAVLLAFCVAVLAVWLIEKVRFNILQPNELPVTVSDSLLTMIGFYMEQNARMRTDLISCVLLFMSLLFAGFMVGNSYGSGLAGIMTIPQYEKSIDSTVDLVNSGLLWGGNTMSWIYSILQTTDPTLRNLLANFRLLSEESIVEHAKIQDIGFSGERTEFHHFVPADYVDNKASTRLQLLNEDLYWDNVAAIVSKSCPFKQKLNDLIMQVKQSGVQHYWELQAAYHYLHVTVQTNILNARSAGTGNEVVRITVMHFLGAYMILVAGLGTASFVFCLEILISRLNGFANPWKFTEIHFAFKTSKMNPT